MGKMRSEKRGATTGGDAPTGKQGIVFNKDFGQHILKNPLVVQAIVDKVFYLCFFMLPNFKCY